MRTRHALALIAFSGVLLLAFQNADADDTRAKRADMVAKAVEFLRTEGQADDGSFTAYAGIGPTALITAGLLENGTPADDPMVAKALKYLEGYIQEDGGIYNAEGLYRNYETCLAVLAFVAANDDGRYDRTLKGAEAYIKGLQWDESEGKTPEDLDYGGGGYGKHERPDMSNTTFFVEALHAAGVEEDDPAMQKALVFLSRCQNLETQHNTTEWAPKINDGGFYYTCAAGGESKAGETANGGLRSYASMTYAGLKSMIHAGLDADDPRVKAAKEWISKHYTLKENPGMDAAGLYYYYNVFAKTMDALEIDDFEDASGTAHDWRAEIVDELASRQKPNGAWINDENERWLEGDPNLTTGYVLMVLARTKTDE